MSKSATKEKPPIPAPALTQPPLEPCSCTAAELLGWLKETGLPPRLDATRADTDEDWLRLHPGATGEEFYRHLEATRAKSGTLRRAGKKVWGPRFEPESVVKQAPADELLRLREENARLQDNVRTLQADKLGLTQANDFLKEELRRLANAVGFLKAGRSQDDLRAAGLAN